MASLSSTHSVFSAANCIDGKTENSRDANMCATKEENAPWLAIDYGTDVLVERVEIFNRINCCGTELEISTSIFRTLSQPLQTRCTTRGVPGSVTMMDQER